MLLTAIGASFAFGMRHEALSARNAVEIAQARAAADGAVERTVYELTRPRIAGSVASCIRLLLELAKVSAAMPTTTSITANSQ